ncbi:nicotinate-nucleotide--dimethylbenzimidazole phosphoribosyltransferase [Paenibacillus sabinae]|uniref:nicotinate-nucleotide--dimethylbenzimidazole phosphoribosyltransferase n=1 Tax=Paenibacillus sabinae TaxID=365617 RepID=UPI00046D0095|nr:nicotinate-nucleotide--dimethylbenzimidazole phosphoribosyltransferase [Paenibacillus sabinae]
MIFLGKLLQVLNEIERLNIVSMHQMRKRVNNLTKPLGSLGRLEEIAIRLAGITGSVQPSVGNKAIIVMCGDHGVVQEGVSAYPQEVTGLMMANFIRQSAAVNVLAHQAGAEVHVVDIGTVLTDLPEGVIQRKVRPGTANMAKGPAMTKEEAVAAIHVGIDMASELADKGIEVIGLGEMGIGNTTPSSAMTAVFTNHPVERITGRGTGINDEALAAKAKVIERAIEVNRPNPGDAVDVLAKVGGLEIAGLAGVILGAAARKVPVVIDGVITGAAALAAFRIEPRCRDYLFASHLSVEPAHRIVLDELGLKPLLHLDMRLGEGTGAALALPVIESALQLVSKMATFEDLGIPSPAPEEDEFGLAVQ